MVEARQAVAVITEYMASNNMDVPDAVREAAEVYAVACRRANERLVTCDQLLRTNQRAEALRQAQLEPDVLKLYADLDIRDWPRWEQVALQVGLAVPPRLNAAAAQRLNKAFAEQQAVGELLRQHRTLALCRAPLRQRLDVVRLLARAEPTNLGWADDLAVFETARFEEIRAAVSDPRAAADWGLLDELLRE